MASPVADGVRTLVSRLDDAMALGGCEAVTQRVKSDLSSLILNRSLDLPDRFHCAREECYARRLLHDDPGGRYSVVVMTWGPGQGTPLHDHAGIWCVEAVLKGEMEVAQFDLLEDRGSTCRFRETSRVHAAVGTSGCLIPPFEYHILRNADPDAASITVHVYGGEMSRCSAFEPREDGWYDRREKTLTYHD